jgi:hypothetical protein
MQHSHAIRILHALANGIHPATGERFAGDSPYQHPDTVRAMFHSIRAIETVRDHKAATQVERRTALDRRLNAGDRRDQLQEDRRGRG